MAQELFAILESASMRLVTQVNEDFDDTAFALITAFDTVVHTSTNVIADASANTITVNKAGLYEVNFGFLFSFPGTEEIELIPFINGTATVDVGAGLQGRTATKPVSFYWSSTIELSAGDVIDLRAKNAASGSVTCTFYRSRFQAKFIGS